MTELLIVSSKLFIYRHVELVKYFEDCYLFDIFMCLAGWSDPGPNGKELSTE